MRTFFFDAIQGDAEAMERALELQEARAQLDAETVRPVRLCLGCHREEGDEETVASR